MAQGVRKHQHHFRTRDVVRDGERHTERDLADGVDADHGLALTLADHIRESGQSPGVQVQASAQDDPAALPQYHHKPIGIARIDAVTTSAAIHDHTAIVDDYRRV
ncbi:MAG: hypothetical protein H0U97_05470 [Gammaproteobacteria bacterium]|nr:hypothetical protein [Gammaproteobacteria bacterium]